MPKWVHIAQLYEFVLFGVLGFGPLILVAWKNARALPVGLLGFLSLAMLTFGFVIFAMSPSSNRIFQLLAAVVLAALTVLSFRFAADGFGSRIGWSVLSLVAWMMAFMFGQQLIDNIKRDAGFAKARVERVAEEAEIARKRAELEADPTKRGPVLARQLSKYAGQWYMFLGQARYITFGDPASDPDHVTVWAVITLNEHQRLEGFNHNLTQLFTELNYRLPREGYRWPVGVGAVESRDVAAAGGDSAFFGPDGSNVIPQWPATTTQAEISQPSVPPLQPPARRGRATTAGRD
jgi:hypothetical protein